MTGFCRRFFCEFFEGCCEICSSVDIDFDEY